MTLLTNLSYQTVENLCLKEVTEEHMTKLVR